MAQEVYQIEDAEDLQQLVEKLNIILFAIARRLGVANFETPVDLSSATTVANIVTALEDAGIGES